MSFSRQRRHWLGQVLTASLTQWPLAQAHAGCDGFAFTEAAALRLDTRRLLLVTHASSAYDSRLATKRGLDELLRRARAARIPAIYLADDSPPDAYFPADCQPNAWVFSEGGELRFQTDADHVLLAGGHLEICLNRTIHALLDQWARRRPRDRRLTLVADAIYANAREIDELTPYFKDVSRFLDVVASARPGGEHWRKLTMLELMTLIRDDVQRRDYLASVLPHDARAMPAPWRIVMRWDGRRELELRASRGPTAATLVLEVVDTMFDEDSPLN
ncbi:MAG: hypothetical protein R3E87_10760 [Burkholderiaceae bacterium]